MGAVSEPLIQWFELNRRLLPFRQEPSAYHIWVSEIMLQQTRVSAALPYYERFVAELPDPAALAACDPDKLRKLWQGLGYYSRVANMQKAAQIVCRQWGLHGWGYCLHCIWHPSPGGGRQRAAGICPAG